MDDISIEELDLDDHVSSPSIGLLGQPSAILTGIVEQNDKSSLHMAFMNMANSIIGAGIIGQAYAVKQAGLVAGICLLVGLTFVIDWTIRLMVTNAKLSSTTTYQSTVQHCFGSTGLVIVSLAQGLFAFGGSMAYCVIIGDTIPAVIAAVFPGLHNVPVLGWLGHRNVVIIIFVMGISYPLSLNRNIGALAKASMLALVSMAVITLTVAIRGPAVSPPEAHMSGPLWTINSGICQAISVISFAFVCHHNSLIIYDSLKTPTMDRFASVVHYSTGVSMVACIILGVGGFLSFKDLTKGNVLNNFPRTDIMANVGRFCFGFNMVTTLPLEIFVCREVIGEFLYPHEPELSQRKNFIIVTILVLMAMGVSLFTCNLGVILELLGSSSACTMAYILPPLCFLHLSAKEKFSKSKLFCYVCIVFGVVVMIISTIQSVIKLVNGGEDSHCIA